MQLLGHDSQSHRRSVLERVRNRAWFRYTAAVVVALLALVLRIALIPLMGRENPYHFSWLAVVVSAWYFGLGPAIVTVLIDTAGACYFLLPPANTFRIETDIPTLSGLAVFFLLSAVIVALGEASRRAVAKRQAAETQLLAYRDTLEKLVDQRTGQLTEANSELANLSTKLLQTQDEERRRLARELHDSAGQLLTALSLGIARIERQVGGADPILSAAAAQGQTIVQQLTQEIRTTSYLLHPPLLDEFGLIDALRHYLSGFSERSEVRTEMVVSDDLERLPPEMELTIFRVVQECLTNVRRHSGSPVATVRLLRDAESIYLSVEDKGKGIPSSKLTHVKSSASGVGLSGIRQRVRQFGGNVHIDSNGSGTTVSATFPLQSSADPPEPQSHASVSA